MTNLITFNPESLPAIIFQNQPVVTTNTLASLYGVSAKSLRDNHRNNTDRFLIGKHFFRLEGAELKAFRHSTENFGAVKLANNVRCLTLWTARGSARHAKMLSTNTAWDVYEKMEDAYFCRTPAPNPQQPLLDAPSSVEERRPLNALIHAWTTMVTGLDYSGAWSQLHAHFGTKEAKELTTGQAKEACAWVQERIDAIAAAQSEKALTAATLEQILSAHGILPSPGAFDLPIDLLLDEAAIKSAKDEGGKLINKYKAISEQLLVFFRKNKDLQERLKSYADDNPAILMFAKIIDTFMPYFCSNVLSDTFIEKLIQQTIAGYELIFSLQKPQKA